MVTFGCIFGGPFWGVTTMRVAIMTDREGVPEVQVPSEQLRDLVEFLSAQRLSVRYSYRSDHFTVSFPRMSAAEVQRTLAQWANAHARIAA
jgi:hypothetical protein